MSKTLVLCLACLVLRWPTLSVADEKPVVRLTPLRTGQCWLGADHVLGDRHTADERLEFAIYAYLVEGPDGETALVDLGPKTLEYTNRMFRRHGFFRDLGPSVSADKRYPDDVRQPEGNVFAQLKKRGVQPADVDHIVFTHLHADHHGMDDAKNGGAAEDFPNALLHVSKRGWDDNLKKRNGEAWNSYVDFAFGDFLLRREKAGKVRFADDVEVMPGVRTLYLGGHSPCSQAVLVDTSEGRVIITSDEVYLYRVLEEAIVAEIRTSEERLVTALDRLVLRARAEDAVLLPLHDPRVALEVRDHPERWLERLRPLSRRACATYLERRSRAHPLTEPERRTLREGFEGELERQSASLEKDAKQIGSYSRRGDARFFLGKFAEAVSDYDRMVELEPDRDASHWRRGIAYFYAGEVAKAAAQFERYHTVDNVDRENGIWRFLSQTKAFGIEKARQGLLKYEKTDREPFPDVYRMFAGEISGLEVLENIETAALPPAELEKRRFYAHLYVGLMAVVTGRSEDALFHLRQSTANDWGRNAGFGPSYMWHVGRVHYERLLNEPK